MDHLYNMIFIQLFQLFSLHNLKIFFMIFYRKRNLFNRSKYINVVVNILMREIQTIFNSNDYYYYIIN